MTALQTEHDPHSHILEKFVLPLYEVYPKLFVDYRCSFQENSVSVEGRGLHFIIDLVKQAKEWLARVSHSSIHVSNSWVKSNGVLGKTVLSLLFFFPITAVSLARKDLAATGYQWGSKFRGHYQTSQHPPSPSLLGLVLKAWLTTY